MINKFSYFTIFIIALFNFIFFIKLAFKEKKYKQINNKLKKILYILGLGLGIFCTILVMYLEIIFLIK